MRGDGRETLHARAEVVLAADLPPAPPARPAAARPLHAFTPEEIYRRVLFHGPDMQGIERVEACDDRGVTARLRPAPAPAEWLRRPLRQKWIADPLVLDGGFQMMILWSFARSGAAGLPCYVARYRQYRRAFPADGARVVLNVVKATDLSAVGRPRFPVGRRPGGRPHGRRRVHPRPGTGTGVPAQSAGTSRRKKGSCNEMSGPPRVAIVGMGGLFPSAATRSGLWADVLAAADRSRDVPPGRWMLDPDAIFDPAVAAPDNVYSRRGYFLDDSPARPLRSPAETSTPSFT